jgi:hypothetical protein
MSRAYRIRVREGLSRVLRASDHVSTQLEILGILPPEEMAGLLREELAQRGYRDEGGRLVRERDGVSVTVDPTTGEVTVAAAADHEVTVEGERQGYAFDEEGHHAEQARRDLTRELRKELAAQADQKEAELQGQLTARLEGQLGDLRSELNQAVNRVTATALKRKAAQMGQIKEVTEDPQTGSMTIVLEV